MPALTHEAKLARIHKAVATGDASFLSPEEGTLMEQLELAFNMLLGGEYTQAQVLDTLCQKYGFSKVTATARIRDSKEVYGDATKGNRAMDAHIAFMRAEHIYMKAMGLSDDKLAPRALEGLDPEERLMVIMETRPTVDLQAAIQAVRTMVQIRGLDKDEARLVDPAELQGKTILGINKQTQQLLAALRASCVVNLSEIFANVPEAQLLLNTSAHEQDQEDEAESEGEEG